MSKKIKATAVNTQVIVPHKYQIKLTFDIKANMGPLLNELIPKSKYEVFDVSTDEIDYYFPDNMEYFVEILPDTKEKKVTLTIGYNDRKKMQKILEKHVEVMKPTASKPDKINPKHL